METYWQIEKIFKPKASPLSILRNHAIVLREETQQLLEATLEVSSNYNRLSISFGFMAPSVTKFKFQILTFDEAEIYSGFRGRFGTYFPMSFSNGTNILVVQNEEQFNDVLKSTLSSKQLVSLMANMINEAKHIHNSFTAEE